MGIGPQKLGSAGMSKNSKPCGSPLTKMSDKRKARKKARAVKKLKVPADSSFDTNYEYAKKEARKLSDSPMTKRGLWDNIHAKRKRIAKGSGEKMRKPGSKGAPSAKALKESQS